MRPYDVQRIPGVHDSYKLVRLCECGKGTTIQVRSQDLWDYEHGKHAQRAFPYISPDDREAVFITGICANCWNKMFGSDEEEE